MDAVLKKKKNLIKRRTLESAVARRKTMEAADGTGGGGRS